MNLVKKYVITKGLDKCLFVYSLSNFEKIVNKLSTLQFTRKKCKSL
ncbi:MAG: MraZ N-terminal domain containing protein [Clostridium sp.]|nr:MAG: MraZ N-terminal domain containing protein [Clostridium sp.]